MKAQNHSWWIGAIVGAILTLTLTGGPAQDNPGMLIIVGLVSGAFWGWIIGLIIDSIRAKTTKNKKEKDAIKNPITIPKPNTSVNNDSAINSDKNEIAELLYEFSMNQDAMKELEKINSEDPEIFFAKFWEIFKNEVFAKTGVTLQSPDASQFKSFRFSFTTRTEELDKGRGKLLFISNNLGDVFKNPEGRVICSNKYIILGVEEGKLTRWLYMHLSGRIHEPQMFLLKEGDIIPCGSLLGSSYFILYNELNRRLEKTPTQKDWNNLMDEFYNKI